MMRISILASGSKGNSVFIETRGAKILVDAGLSGKELSRRLKGIGYSPSDLDAIVVSHEHIDHILGMGTISRKFDIPVYISDPTRTKSETIIGKLENAVVFKPGNPFSLLDMDIYPFEVTHDAVGPVNFVIRSNGVKLGICTDLGYVSTLVKEALKNCHALIVETNHDIVMLENGPYPWPLKQRIKSKFGHLSNEQGSSLIADVIHDGLKHIWLAHISEKNNRPDYALNSIKSVLGEKLLGIEVKLAQQDRADPLTTIKTP
jgi:phosphoribosyl 1,2-cyclic phosphodiesterase